MVVRFRGSDGIDAAQFMQGPGDMWLDTSTVPPTLRICEAVNPVTFRRIARKSDILVTTPVLPIVPLPPFPTFPLASFPAVNPASISNATVGSIMAYVNSLSAFAAAVNSYVTAIQPVFAQVFNNVISHVQSLVSILHDGGTL
jgi:hypothetical protein